MMKNATIGITQEYRDIAVYRLFYDGAAINPLLLVALRHLETSNAAADPKAEAWTSLFQLCVRLA